MMTGRLLCTAGLHGAMAYFADRQRFGQHCLACGRIVDCANRRTIPELEGCGVARSCAVQTTL